jgi:microcystin-dependent protein
MFNKNDKFNVEDFNALVKKVEDKIAAVSVIPRGVISMWSGAINTIPDGWALCDGNNGTPNLRNRFIAGAGAQYAVGDVGGNDVVTLTADNMPRHTHIIHAIATVGSVVGHVARGAGGAATAQDTSAAGAGAAHENRPPYYALAFIMKL